MSAPAPRLALVTGGTRGIGRAIAISLQNAGYQVVVNYSGNEEAAQKMREETGIKTYKWDVSNYGECEKGIQTIVKEHGAIDILINNAGITRDSMLHKMNTEQWETVLDTNLSSCFYLSKLVIGFMREKAFGRIVNITSINGQAGQLGQTNYSASKAGMIGFTKALALENASKGITVNAVAPGYIKTDMVANVKENVLQKIISDIPVGRLGEPEDVARCVLFLVKDEASFITGSTLTVNGGHYLD